MKRFKAKLYIHENIHSMYLIPTKPKAIRANQCVALNCVVCDREVGTFGDTLWEGVFALFEGYYYVLCSVDCREMYNLCELAYADDHLHAV